MSQRIDRGQGVNFPRTSRRRRQNALQGLPEPGLRPQRMGAAPDILQHGGGHGTSDHRRQREGGECDRGCG